MTTAPAASQTPVPFRATGPSQTPIHASARPDDASPVSAAVPCLCAAAHAASDCP